MPFAAKFRATMDFPGVGESLGSFTVEAVEVGHEGIGGGVYEYPFRIVLKGKRGKQGAKNAARELLSSVKPTFSGYGNPYQCRFDKSEVRALDSGVYELVGRGIGVRIYLEQELEGFLKFVGERGHLNGLPSEDLKTELVTSYLKTYQTEVEKQVRRYKKN